MLSILIFIFSWILAFILAFILEQPSDDDYCNRYKYQSIYKETFETSFFSTFCSNYVKNREYIGLYIFYSFFIGSMFAVPISFLAHVVFSDTSTVIKEYRLYESGHISENHLIEDLRLKIIEEEDRADMYRFYIEKDGDFVKKQVITKNCHLSYTDAIPTAILHYKVTHVSPWINPFSGDYESIEKVELKIRKE